MQREDDARKVIALIALPRQGAQFRHDDFGISLRVYRSQDVPRSADLHERQWSRAITNHVSAMDQPRECSEKERGNRLQDTGLNRDNHHVNRNSPLYLCLPQNDCGDERIVTLDPTRT